ncbi:MAG: ABC transporter permease, partial [Acinetobacter calcoaceticus]
MSSLHWYERNFFQTLIRERQVRFGFVVTALILIFALLGPLFVPFEPTAL